jgi:hypothetical protein
MRICQPLELDLSSVDEYGIGINATPSQ